MSNYQLVMNYYQLLLSLLVNYHDLLHIHLFIHFSNFILYFVMHNELVYRLIMSNYQLFMNYYYFNELNIMNYYLSIF